MSDDQAPIWAAYEAAADFVESLEGYDSIGGEHPLVSAIRDLTPADAREARERALAEAREAERKAIFERITECIDAATCDGINAEGEFSEERSRSPKQSARYKPSQCFTGLSGIDFLKPCKQKNPAVVLTRRGWDRECRETARHEPRHTARWG